MKEFENDYEQGKQYCINRGWTISLKDNSILSINSKAMFGFKFNYILLLILFCPNPKINPALASCLYPVCTL